MYFNNGFRFVLALDKRSRKPKGQQSRRDNPETLATLGTQDEDKQSKKPTEKTETMSNTDPTKKSGGEPRDSRRVS